MIMVYKVAFVYFLMINLLTFTAFGSDKRRARKGRWRIPEQTLLLLALAGGALGAACGMYVFHHKTKKRKFTLTVPAMIGLHAVIVYLLWSSR